MFDVICIGSSTVDVFAKTAFSELIKIKSNDEESSLLAYPTGSKILIEELDFTTGGGGTNVSVSLAKLGLKVSYLGAVGKDANAQHITDVLYEQGVDTRLMVHKKGQTGFSIILDSIEHDRTILAHKGVNNSLLFTDIKKPALQTKWFYFASMMGKAYETLEKIAAFAERNDIDIAFNCSSYLCEKGTSYLRNILPRVTILVVNLEEAELLVGKDEINELCKKLHAFGPKYIVITDGKKGAYCSHEGYLYFARTNNIKVVETTGAGDAFASSFLAGIILNKGVEVAMQIATTNAESVISNHGAKNKLLTWLEAKAVLRKRPVKVTKKRLK